MIINKQIIENLLLISNSSDYAFPKTYIQIGMRPRERRTSPGGK